MTTIRPGMPFAENAIAKFLDKRIDELKGVKTQREIAAEVGYDKPNIISMFKRGETKVPLDKVLLLAKALDTDPAHLIRLGLEQSIPGFNAIMDDLLGIVATKNEARILLTKWRKATKDLDPGPSPDIDAAVDEMIERVSARAAR